MIISHKYKFIFIKTHKTAGSSIEMALAPLCDVDDVITPMESNQNSDIPRNFHAKNWIGRTYATHKLVRKCLHRHSQISGPWYYEHMPAFRVKELVGDKIWSSYYKFCFERNPWDKIVSYYNWKKYGQKRSMPSFANYVLHKTHRLPVDSRLYFDQDECIVDQIYDFSNFIDSFRQICQQLGVPFSGEMPREKTGINLDLKHYSKYYNQETRKIVADYFSKEIALMGYNFDGIDL